VRDSFQYVDKSDKKRNSHIRACGIGVGMITQKKMKEWYPEILAGFEKTMPDIKRPLPELVIGTKATWMKKRAFLIEQLQSNQINPDGTGAMETIHGVNGDVILVYQHILGNQVNDYSEFRHCIWHELGHVTAINTQNPSFIRFMDQQPHPDEYEAFRGYFFWSEFIAEKTACDLEPEVEIDWSKADYRIARNHLGRYLVDGTEMKDDVIDWYWLSFYFARVLSDKVIQGYLKAAEDGTLKCRRAYGDKEMPFNESGIDPLCLDIIDESFRPIVMEIKGILDSQIKRNNPYDVSFETISALGDWVISIERLHKMNEFRQKLGLF